MSENFLRPVVDCLLDVAAITLNVTYNAYDKWGNLIYRLIEGEPYTDECEDMAMDKIEYTFIPLEELEFKNVIDYKYLEGDKEGLKVCLGYDIENNSPVWVDMLESHLLIAGASRWGKSNILNVLITGLMLSYTPNEVKFILCDYKNADMKQFEKYKHIAADVVIEQKELEKCFDLIKREMKARAKILNKADCLNAINYNKKSNDKLTYIIFVIDELVQVTIDNDIKKRLHEIMSKCASYGIYFILASQDCAKETIGRCKINVSHTIGLHTRDKTDSDLIIKDGELEEIKVKGRAKYDCGDITEFQSFYISEEQIKSLLEPLLKEDKTTDNKVKENA